MAKVIKYQGIIQNWSEQQITGKPATWRISQQEEREEAEAVLLLNTRLFTEVVPANRLAGVGKISGNFAVGGKVTCSLPWGFTGTFQWTRTLIASPYTKTNISGATASNVNGLDYTLVTGDATLYNIDCDITAIVQKVAGSQQASTAAPIVPVAPATISAPAIVGGATVGASLNVTAGVFSGVPTPSVIRSFRLNGVTVATASSYTLQSADVGKTLVVREVASNSAGDVTADSAGVVVVAAGGTGVAPTVTSNPAIVGTPTVGVAVSVTAGVFTGTPAPTVVRSFLVDGVNVATAASYTPVTADAGKALIVREVATNASGTVTANSSAVAIASAAGGATWRNVSNKVVNQGQPYTAYKQVGSTTAHINFQDVTALKVVDSNWGTNAGQEPLSGADNIVSVAVEYPLGSTPQRFLFSGATTGTNPSGSDLESDALTLAVAIPKNTPYKIHRYITNTAGVFLAGGLTTAEGDCCKFSASGLADLTGQTSGYTGTSTGANFMSPPSAILAFHNGVSLGAVGDSRFVGALDNTTDATKYPIGQIGRLVRPLYPYIQFACTGETQTQFRATNLPRRCAFLIKYCTHVVVEHAINGFSTSAAAKTNVGAIWKIFGDAGLKVYHTTTTPRTSGAWTATDGSDQVESTDADELVLWNTYLRTTPAPLTGFIEIAPIVTMASNPKKWKAPGYTADGLHETTLANLAIRDAAPITASTFV